MRSWLFQHSEPTRWSEYKIRSPFNIVYAAMTLGYEPFEIRETNEVKQVFKASSFSIGANQETLDCYEMHWATKDLPAVRDEPFMYNIDDYLNRVHVQLASYTFGLTPHKVITDWNSLNKDLYESDYFGDKIDDTGDVDDVAEKVTNGLTKTEDKVKAIYNWVSKSIVYSGSKTFYSDQDVDDVLESKKGNSAEITFLFLSLLKSIDVKAEPVILSTRGKGIVQENFPILSQFNSVIARVNIDSTNYFMSPTNPLRPKELLPIDVLNVRGLVIKEDQPEWVTITSDKQYKSSSVSNITISNDGATKGTFEDIYYDYGNLITRDKIKDKSDKEIAKNIFDTDMNGAEIDSLIFENKDSTYSPLKITASFNSPNYALVNEDMIYINPHIIHRMEENPFKKKERIFPIDYSYKSSTSTTVNLIIPDGFEVKENIQNKSTRVTNNMATFNRIVKTEGNKITIQTDFNINATQIQSKYYEQLKYFYTTVVAYESEQIVLTHKKSESQKTSEVGN